MYIYNIYIFIIFIANNTIHPVIIKNNDEARLVNNTVLYQEESVKPLHNFNKKSEFLSSTFCILSYKIEEEPDHIDKPVTVNSSTLELVCIAPQLNNVIVSTSFGIQVEKREFNKDIDGSITDTKINEDRCNYIFCFPRLLCY